MTEPFVDDYCPACATDPCRCVPAEAVSCPTGCQYITRPRGGPPDLLESWERVTFCRVCGAEPAEED